VARLFRDDDADLSLIQDRQVAVLGYDAQSAAQALCLRDSGVDVRIGLLEPGPSWQDAVADGLRVVTRYEACEEADLLVVTAAAATPDLAADLLANLVVGDVLVLLDAAAPPGPPPPGVDVLRVSPWADGAIVREEFEQGRGVPVFGSVLADSSGAAWDTLLAYARAIGATRAGVLRADDAEYLRARDEAESALMLGGVLPAIRRSVDTLVASGCQPELAYLLCVDGLRGFADRLARGELDDELAAARSIAADDSGDHSADHSASDSADDSADDSGVDPLPAAARVVRSLMAWAPGPDSRLH